MLDVDLSLGQILGKLEKICTYFTSVGKAGKRHVLIHTTKNTI